MAAMTDQNNKIHVLLAATKQSIKQRDCMVIGAGRDLLTQCTTFHQKNKTDDVEQLEKGSTS